ncbi:S9 family peptidase [Streptomyces sp. OF3]|uniref:S9 family peptidase n=1 Tax=Streptomyces alkaliterrae TaxID=2213162 RepID=A0A7W3WGI1_9ACTN|nr:prolyl oligopeptidase family serine peptidase [Streptomyces alkaliterrae]MBB1251894.1 S9 family peptidase [Streptomyces alkaliterrae]
MSISHARYGTWPSPIDAALVAARDGRPEYLTAVGEELWWTAPRPAEDGRRALLRLTPDGRARSELPPPWNVRSRFTEYGGQPFAGQPREQDGPLVVFCHFADQRLYAFEPDGPEQRRAPRPLTPPAGRGGGPRYVDPLLLPDLGEVWCVREEFTGDRPTDVRRALVAVPLDGSAAHDPGALRELVVDGHFLAGPRRSPDGRHLLWLTWDHPRMPWESTLLRLAELDTGGTRTVVGTPRTLLGGPSEAVAQADWAADGTLLAVSDRTGWWNPHRVPLDGGPPVNLCARQEEFADALWKPGQRWFATLPDGLLAVLHGRGAARLGVLDPSDGHLVDAPGDWTEWASTLAVVGDRLFGVAASPRSGPEIVELDTATGHARVVAEEHHDVVDPAYYPDPRLRTFTGPGGRTVHAHLHPPHHPHYAAADEEAPPYVVWAHGGPTGRAPQVLDLEIAYFTSRGIGVVQVDYAGSTGYGRAYRERLRGEWGVADVEDCAAVARALADEGVADRDRLAIRGGSAGGWTAACSLVSPATEGLYAGAVISYPVLDPSSFAEVTHDLESHYLTSLIGPPDTAAARYRERSPVRRADRVRVPFLLLQGLDDAVCPPEQCERFLAALDRVRSPHTYLTFEGEGHGFRRQDTVVRALEAELALYRQVFGIERGG